MVLLKYLDVESPVPEPDPDFIDLMPDSMPRLTMFDEEDDY